MKPAKLPSRQTGKAWKNTDPAAESAVLEGIFNGGTRVDRMINTGSVSFIVFFLFLGLLFRKVKAPVLDRLGDVFHADFFRAVQIRDRAGHAQDSVIASC